MPLLIINEDTHQATKRSIENKLATVKETLFKKMNARDLARVVEKRQFLGVKKKKTLQIRRSAIELEVNICNFGTS